MKILIISTGNLPVPAEKGGAVEKLIQDYLEYNEKEHMHDITLLTIPSARDYNEDFKYTKFIYIENNDFIYKVSRACRYIINNKLPFLYVGNAFIKRVEKYLQKNYEKYDLVLVENNPYAILNLRKIFPNEKIYLHLHNDYLNNTTKYNNKIYSSYNKIIAISNYIKTRVETIGKWNKTTVIYNGVDVSSFSREIVESEIDAIKNKYDIKQNDVVLLYTGRLVPEKGIQELIKATNKLIDKYNNVKLLIAGSRDGNSIKKRMFEKKLNNISKKNSKKIFFMGYVKNNDLPVIHKIANIQIIPSKWAEPLGNVVIEGLASGIQQIATKDGGIIELAKNSRINLIANDHLEENIFESLNSIMTRNTYNDRYKNSKLISEFSLEKYSMDFLKELSK